MVRQFRAAIASMAKIGMRVLTRMLMPMLIGTVAVVVACADGKAASMTLENKEVAADDLRKMGLQAKDVVLSIDATDLEGGAGAKPQTIRLAAKEKKTISLQPAIGGSVNVKLEASFHGQKCTTPVTIQINDKKTIRILLKAATPKPVCEIQY
jgi:hypothetical protein